MKTTYNYSLIRQAVLIALLGWGSAANAVTIIEKDTLIDGNSPVDEEYSVENKSTLTANGATTGSIDVASGSHLAMNDGTKVNGNLTVWEGGTANIDSTTITGSAFIDGKADITNTVIEQQLILFGGGVDSPTLSASNISARQFYASNGGFIINRGSFDDRGDSHSVGAVYLSSSSGAFSDSIVTGGNAGFYLESFGNDRYSLQLLSSRVWSIDGPAFDVAHGNYDISLGNGSHAGSQSGELLVADARSNVSLSLDGSSAAGNVRAEEGGIVDVSLTNGSVLSGGMTNVRTLNLGNASIYEMTADSDIKTMKMEGGAVKFAPPSEDGHRTLTLGSLLGNGHFYMNVDINNWRADWLDITDSATGQHVLHIAATGLEASSSDALNLVRAGGGDAKFALDGGLLDIGAWQHELIQNGDNWELVQTGDNGSSSGRTTSASTDALLSMASAPIFMHEGELTSLQSRVVDIQQNHKSGAWGTYLNNRSDVEGAWQSAYRLEQNGFMLGGDKVSSLSVGELATGAFLSHSNGKVKHARGGDSRITSYGGGIYATLYSGDGWYANGTLQLNHFDSKLSAKMSDGVSASGNWDTWGYGLSLEGGRQLWLSERVSLTPYLGVNAWQNQSDSVTLSNGMTAETGAGRSLRGEAGLRIAASLQAGKMVVTPFATTALLQELVKSESTKINDAHEFTNDFTGTGGRITGGVSVAVTPSTQVWLEASYGKSEYTESPLTGNLGLRVNF